VGFQLFDPADRSHWDQLLCQFLSLLCAQSEALCVSIAQADKFCHIATLLTAHNLFGFIPAISDMHDVHKSTESSFPLSVCKPAKSIIVVQMVAHWECAVLAMSKAKQEQNNCAKNPLSGACREACSFSKNQTN